MSKSGGPRRGRRAGRVVDVQFVEVEFVAPVGTRMVIELEGGVRLLLADDNAVALAGEFLDYLAASPRQRQSWSQKGEGK